MNALQLNTVNIVNELHKRLTKRSVYIPKGIIYGLPTSEKSFIGNIPLGTTFTNKRFIGAGTTIGIYWRNEWGARDLDLSADGLYSRVGWNSNYSNEGLIYSGDITNAPNGAVEYLNAKNLQEPYAIKLNVFNGSDTSKFNLILADGVGHNQPYMMDPNNLKLSIPLETTQTQTTIGVLTKDESFILTNLASGAKRIGTNDKENVQAIDATIARVTQSLNLNDLLEELDFPLVNTPEEADFDLSLDKLEKSTFFELLK